MANIISVKINVNTLPLRAAMGVGVALAGIGLPASVVFAMVRPFAWARFTIGRELPWQGWKWVGRDMAVTNG
jgi:hypothetical protein